MFTLTFEWPHKLFKLLMSLKYDFELTLLTVPYKHEALTAAVAQWLKRSPREQEVVGLIPDSVSPKTL